MVHLRGGPFEGLTIAVRQGRRELALRRGPGGRAERYVPAWRLRRAWPRPWRAALAPETDPAGRWVWDWAG
jgi:hypothetical protein